MGALQTRLSEIAEDAEGIAGRSLLTSYQHDAVENVASVTQVYGLPAIKVGRKRGHTEDADGFERWRRDRVESVSAQLVHLTEIPAAVKKIWAAGQDRRERRNRDRSSMRLS